MLDLKENNKKTESNTLMLARKHKSSTLIAIPNNHQEILLAEKQQN